MSSEGKCASCGTKGGNGTKLRNCTACRMVQYCGVDCQRKHRPKHKKACKQRAAELETNSPEDLYMGSEKLTRMVENGEVSPDRLLFAHNFGVSPDDPQQSMEEAKFLSERRSVLDQAYFQFSTVARVSYNSGFDFERHYRELYDDIQKYHDVWFDKLFNVDNPDPTHAEFTTGILGTLCTILRQRGDLEECQEVMKTYMAVLKRYQQMSEGCGIIAQERCCEQLTFKAYLIRCNLGVQIGDKEMAMTAFHEVVKYEKKEKAAGRYDSESNPDMDGMLGCFFGHSNFDKIDDDDIFNVLAFMNKETMKSGPQLKPRECGYYNCDNKEQMSGDFNLCSKCHEQPYCGKDCQVKDWKIHKQICCGKNKTNIDDDTLLMIMTQLVSNYSTTVGLHSNKKVSSKQKDAAAAALLKKLMKMFPEEFPHFNSQNTVADAGTDPEVCQALADFFAEQPGFEKVWGKFRVGYGESIRLKNEARSSPNTLSMSDDTIRNFIEEFVPSVFATVAVPLCDGDVSKAMAKQSVLVDALVGHTKEFMLENKQYDSFSGMNKLTKDPDFQAKLITVLYEVYECAEGGR